jgi:predicted ATPase
MRLVQHIKVSHLLSFGPEGLDLELHDLNVLKSLPKRLKRLGGSGFLVNTFEYQQSTMPRVFFKGSFVHLKSIIPEISILAQRRDPETYSILWAQANAYEKIHLYREWSFGRNTIFRTPQRADLRNDRLESDFSNLGMVLSRLRKTPAVKRAFIAALQNLYEGFTDFEVVTEGGSVQVFFTEGDFSIPATRLSDGTLRYLCLLAILLDPTPPSLICIEEPELGLHPDLLPKIADLLVDASIRTQLVVTTHSDVLIDALSERPETVLVCEKHEGRTQIKRLDRADIGHWLEDYRLGQLWTRGEIGGTRW